MAPPLFRVERISKVYPMGEMEVHALREVSLDVRAGEFLVILGPSGSGKSTLLNILGGIDTPSSGEIHFKDEKLSDFSEAQLTQFRRRHIGFVFQFYNLMPNLTAQENVEMATEISPDPMDAREALGLVDLDERRDHFPSQLSGGEQQRVAIARAVAKQPEVLLCDEPTGALDIETGKIVLRALNDINERIGATVIIITHNAAIAEMGHRVARMADGEVRELKDITKRIAAQDLEW
ncbi:MAG: ABC transporter ATP-binding protein [Candidatus Hydrogenedentes bacterium]|nr:ABC transporter ATP-binding protein [Candidatus Hydrogenedentota bacterium]